jgi:hypothetical protein
MTNDRYVCLICTNFGYEDPFVSEESDKVGDHIWFEHNQHHINYFVTKLGAGWKKVLKEENES